MLLFLSACKKPVETEESLNEKLDFNYSEYKSVLQTKLLTFDSDLVKQDTLIQYYDTLKSFYRARNYEPVFIKSFDDKKLVDSMLIFFGNAEEHGMNAEQYHFSSIKREFYKAIDTIPNAFRYANLANTEFLISEALLKYSYHLRYGMVNPKVIFSDSYFLPIDDSSKGDLFQPLKQENILKYLADIQPKSKRYKSLQIALKYYNRFKELDWPQIPVPVKKIEIGAKDTTVSLIISRLITLEYLDTSKVKLKEAIASATLVEVDGATETVNSIPDGTDKNSVAVLNAKSSAINNAPR